MTDAIEVLVRSVLLGAGRAALMDAWALLARRAFSVQGLDYALLGRWIGHFPPGRFFHDSIATTEPIRWERPLGWLAHYAIGIAFAFPLLATWGLDWARSPTILPPMLIGFATIVARGSTCSPAWDSASQRRDRRGPARLGFGTSPATPRTGSACTPPPPPSHWSGTDCWNGAPNGDAALSIY